MKKLIFVLLAVVTVASLSITPAKQADARVLTRPCGEWMPDATSAVNNGAHIVNSNQTQEGTYITVEITCEKYDGGCAPTCWPYTVTLQHVYFYPAAS